MINFFNNLKTKHPKGTLIRLLFIVHVNSQLYLALSDSVGKVLPYPPPPEKRPRDATG